MTDGLDAAYRRKQVKKTLTIKLYTIQASIELSGHVTVEAISPEHALEQFNAMAFEFNVNAMEIVNFTAFGEPRVDE